MQTSNNSQFKSRFGFIAAAIGMAVGTGNMWRFPRVAAANGGGAFLVALQLQCLFMQYHSFLQKWPLHENPTWDCWCNERFYG